MKSYKKWTTAGVSLTFVGVLTGCGTANHKATSGKNATNNITTTTNSPDAERTNTSNRVPTNASNNSVASNDKSPSNNTMPPNTTDTQINNTNGRATSNRIRGNVLTLSVKLSNRTSLPSIRKGFQPFPASELHSAYGTIQASTAKKTNKPLQITMTDHGSKNIIYVDNSKTLKWLMGWQLNQNYLLLNIGEPYPNMATADFGGEAVVINLKTKQVTLKRSISMESTTREYITPNTLVWSWSFLPGPSYSTVNFYTRITNLTTDKSVSIMSTTSYPLGQDPYVFGNRVYFARGHNTYYVEIPVAAWSTGVHKPYEVVLKPTVKMHS